jgi:hypothetical protein
MGNTILDLAVRTALGTVLFWPAAYAMGLMKELIAFGKQVKGKVALR